MGAVLPSSCVLLPVDGSLPEGPLRRGLAGTAPHLMALDFIWKHAQSASQHCFVREQIFEHRHTLAPKPRAFAIILPQEDDRVSCMVWMELTC